MELYSFLHAHFTETMKIVEKLFFKKADGEKHIYLEDML